MSDYANVSKIINKKPNSRLETIDQQIFEN